MFGIHVKYNATDRKTYEFMSDVAMEKGDYAITVASWDDDESNVGNLKIVEVVSCSDTVSPAATKWLVQKIDMTSYIERLKKNERIRQIKQDLDRRTKELQEARKFEILSGDEKAAALLAELQVLQS